MKPATIVTTDGIFVLDSTGFYEPYREPEPRISGLWLASAGFIVFCAICGAGWMVFGG
jgi:hypothetical protein